MAGVVTIFRAGTNQISGGRGGSRTGITSSISISQYDDKLCNHIKDLFGDSRSYDRTDSSDAHDIADISH